MFGRESIANHGVAHDLNRVQYARSTRIANNLPEQAKTLQLARDACAALQATTIPPTTVWVADSDFNWECKWLPGSYKRIKIVKYRSKGNGGVLKKLNGPGLPPKQTGDQNGGGQNHDGDQSKAADGQEAPSASGTQSHARDNDEAQDERDAKRRKTSADTVQGPESNVDLDIDEVEESDLEISDDEEDDELELSDDDDDDD